VGGDGAGVPLVASAVIAYAAGLLTGLTDARAWSIAVLGIVVIAAAAQSRLLLVALGVAGIGVGESSKASETACFARHEGRQRWELRVEAPAAPGAFVRGVTGCGAVVRIAVREGTAAAGAAVRAAGTTARTSTGLLMTDARIEVTGGAPFWARWRAIIGAGIDATFGSRGPLVRALLIADMRDLSPAVRETFASAGLSHMLSVSGLHVGLIAAAILLLTQIAGVDRSRAEIITATVTAAYVVLIGAPLPAVRSALMLGAASLSRIVQRPTSAWATLAVGVGLPLVDPRSITDVGYQLSAVGMVALVSAGALGRRWAWLGEGGWRGTLYRSVMTSVIATLFTAPLVAAVFGRISLVAPLTNVVAVPVMALLQPMLFLAAVCLPVTAAARFVADASEPLMVMIDRIAASGAALPGASIPVLTDRVSLALACACVACLSVACVSRFPGRSLVAAAMTCVLIAWRPFVGGGSGMTELHMLDVGQGDALALRTAKGSWVLFDAGREWEGGDAGRRTAIPYITARGGRLHAFVLSHPHSDHVGGAASVIRALRPAHYFDPGYAGASRSYQSSLAAARDGGVAWHRVRPRDSLVVDEAVITFLAPDSAWTDSLTDPNEASVVARIRVGRVAMLMTGDAEAGEERWLLAHQRGELRADLLKVAHHGSRTSSTGEFLDAVQPRVALISVGAANVYRHPEPEVLRALAHRAVVILRADRDGTVVVRTDGSRLEIEARGERWMLPP
jgi:competence protein ComEC